MARTVDQAMQVFEAGRLEEAAQAFEELAGPTGDGLIARFRLSECLSRLGRHDEAVEAARVAASDQPDRPAAPLWLAQCLVEAGRFDELSGVELPPDPTGELGTVAAGFRALAAVASGSPQDPGAVVRAILESRHAPVYSMALRLAEGGRLRGPARWPDPPGVYHPHGALFELDDAKKRAHPDLPPPDHRRDAGRADRWCRLFELAGRDWPTLYALLRPHMELPATGDESDLEEHLALGRLDAAQELLDRMAKERGESAKSDLLVDRVRLAHLRGEALRPSEMPGHSVVVRSQREMLTWLDMAADLLVDDPLSARREADRLSDPSHREYVESALLGWAIRDHSQASIS